MSYCPECGTLQAHKHLGWLADKTRHAQLHCECGKTSIVVISEMKTEGAKLHAEITRAVRRVFGWLQ